MEDQIEKEIKLGKLMKYLTTPQLSKTAEEPYLGVALKLLNSMNINLLRDIIISFNLAGKIDITWRELPNYLTIHTQEELYYENDDDVNGTVILDGNGQPRIQIFVCGTKTNKIFAHNQIDRLINILNSSDNYEELRSKVNEVPATSDVEVF